MNVHKFVKAGIKAKTVKINDGFTCARCGAEVPPAPKTCRNHCRRCLWSLHVDLSVPGDRGCSCKGLMEPARVEKSPKGWMVLHRCSVCGVQCRNCVAPDDDWDKVIELTQFAG